MCSVRADPNQRTDAAELLSISYITGHGFATLEQRLLYCTSRLCLV